MDPAHLERHRSTQLPDAELNTATLAEDGHCVIDVRRVPMARVQGSGSAADSNHLQPGELTLKGDPVFDHVLKWGIR
jgi:hypothetical protein